MANHPIFNLLSAIRLKLLREIQGPMIAQTTQTTATTR